MWDKFKEIVGNHSSKTICGIYRTDNNNKKQTLDGIKKFKCK